MVARFYTSDKLAIVADGKLSYTMLRLLRMEGIPNEIAPA